MYKKYIAQTSGIQAEYTNLVQHLKIKLAQFLTRFLIYFLLSIMNSFYTLDNSRLCLLQIFYTVCGLSFLFLDCVSCKSGRKKIDPIAIGNYLVTPKERGSRMTANKIEVNNLSPWSWAGTFSPLDAQVSEIINFLIVYTSLRQDFFYFFIAG